MYEYYVYMHVYMCVRVRVVCSECTVFYTILYYYTWIEAGEPAVVEQLKYILIRFSVFILYIYTHKGTYLYLIYRLLR